MLSDEIRYTLTKHQSTKQKNTIRSIRILLLNELDYPLEQKWHRQLKHSHNKVPKHCNTVLSFERQQAGFAQSVLIVLLHFLAFPGSLKSCEYNFNRILLAYTTQILNIELVFLCVLQNRLGPAKKHLWPKTSLFHGIFVLPQVANPLFGSLSLCFLNLFFQKRLLIYIFHLINKLFELLVISKSFLLLLNWCINFEVSLANDSFVGCGQFSLHALSHQHAKFCLPFIKEALLPIKFSHSFLQTF